MNVLFLPKEGVSLYSELLNSETSRGALRFYRPVETPSGIAISVASLGSALSLVADLRWYVRKYMRGVLFEISSGVYCSYGLAREVYFDRAVTLGDTWEFRLTYRYEGREGGPGRAGTPRQREILSGDDRIS